MKVRTQPNYDKTNHRKVFGISIMIDESRYYCKYPIGYQNYETEELAKKAVEEVKKLLNNGGSIEYGVNGSYGKNKHEYIKIHANNK